MIRFKKHKTYRRLYFGPVPPQEPVCLDNGCAAFSPSGPSNYNTEF